MGGGHWAALQTVAWARMGIRYTVAAGSLRQGLTQTFDGEHPCELCRQIKAGIEKERHEERQKPGKEQDAGKIKLVAVLPTMPRLWLSPTAREVSELLFLLAGRPSDAPPTLPPR